MQLSSTCFGLKACETSPSPSLSPSSSPIPRIRCRDSMGFFAVSYDEDCLMPYSFLPLFTAIMIRNPQLVRNPSPSLYPFSSPSPSPSPSSSPSLSPSPPHPHQIDVRTQDSLVSLRCPMMKTVLCLLVSVAFYLHCRVICSVHSS